MDEKPVNLKQYQKHEKRFPWALIRKIVIVLVLLGLLIYLSKTDSKDKSPQPNEIKIEIQD